MFKKTLFSVAAMAAALLGATSVQAAVTGTATFSTTVEEGGPFGTTSFQAAGNNASTNTPSDKFPAFGAVAFDASQFLSLAGTGVTPAVTLAATEFTSTSTSTGTKAGSVINFYFGQSPTTTNLGVYDTNNEPSGFDSATFNADLVGSFTYANVSNQVDTINLTLSASDVAYVNSVLTQGSGTFELFAVATSDTDSARWDGTFASALATLTLNGATAAPEPASLSLLGLSGVALLARRRR